MTDNHTDLLKVGRAVTITHKIRYAGHREHTVLTDKGRVLEVTATSVVISAPPIRGLSSNVSRHISFASIVGVTAR